MEEPKSRELTEVLRDGMVFEDRIEALLSEGPMTIPELAEALGCPSREVTYWVMAMWRYGKVVELAKGTMDEYFQYELKQ